MGKIINIIKKYLSLIIKYIKIFINKIKSFLKQIKNKINIKKEKNEKSKIKIFLIGFFSYVGSVVGYLIAKPKEPLKEIEKINKRAINIEKEIENEISPFVLKTYKKEINKKIQKLEKIKNIKTREEIKEIKKEEEHLLNINKKIEEKLINIGSLEKYKVKSEIKNKEEKKFLEIENKVELNNNKKINKEVIKNKVDTNLKKVVITSKKGLKKIKNASLIGGTLLLNKVVKIKKEETKKKIEKLDKNDNIKKEIIEFNNIINKTYNEVRDNNNEIDLLEKKKKIEELKQKYIELTRYDDFIYLKDDYKINSIDSNHLVYHEKSIDDLIDYLNNRIDEVEKEKALREEDLLNEKKKVNDIMLAKTSIKEDISLSMREIKKIKKDILRIPTSYKKPNLITRLSNFFKYSINIGISLIPFGIFKNKLLATLTSGIILNNRIRCMNSIISNSDKVAFIEYENILANLNDRKNYLENTNYVLLDTISQIDLLKIKLNEIDINNSEKEKLLVGLDEMKLDLLEENLKVETTLEEVNKIGKNKIKIKE